MFKKEVELAYKFYNKLNHLSVISNSKTIPTKENKLLWYRLISRKIKRKTRYN